MFRTVFLPYPPPFPKKHLPFIGSPVESCRRPLKLAMKLIDIKLLKFLIVGIVNTLAGAGIMFLLYNLAHCSYWVSSVCNYIAGGIISFFLNKYFTFKNTQKSVKQIMFFILNLAVCYVLAYFLAKWMVYKMFIEQSEKIKDNIAMIFGMILYTGLNYLGQRLLVFNNPTIGWGGGGVNENSDFIPRCSLLQ